MATKYDEAQKRTCKPKWTGIKYIAATARHYNADLLTDAEAIDLLSKGYISETMFDILPKKLIKSKPVATTPKVKKNGKASK